MNVLVIDIGGTRVKVRAAGHKQQVEFLSGPGMNPCPSPTCHPGADGRSIVGGSAMRRA